jgi:hypothetical protein
MLGSFFQYKIIDSLGKIVITTVTSVTTSVMMSSLTAFAFIGMGAVVTLILFLIARELASTGHSRFSLCLTKFTGIGILPLIMVFTVIVAVKIIEII